jgi:hypothetical protein
MYLVHEHNKYTSAIDKYWLFETKEEAQIFYRKMVSDSREFIDYDYYRELFDDTTDTSDADYEQNFKIFIDKEIETPSNYVAFTDNCTLTFVEFDASNYGRRP